MRAIPTHDQAFLFPSMDSDSDDKWKPWYPAWRKTILTHDNRDKWFSDVTTIADVNGIWKYVNPDLNEPPTLSVEPTFPDIEKPPHIDIADTKLRMRNGRPV